jgi:2-methylcitrate dehydratase PrpD
MHETRDLARWVVEVKWGDIPGEIVDYAKILILDTLGCMLGGSLQESNKAALRYIRAMGGTPQASIVNYGDRTNIYNAAFMNGSFGHGWDFDDHVIGGSPHSMSATTAAALAIAEWQLSSGRDLLEAWIAGFEANNRIGAASEPGLMNRGFHHVGTIGSFAGAAVASKLLHLDDWKTENAFAITVSQAAATFQHSQTTGGAIKRNHMGFASSNGVRSALLASEGITGPREALEGKFGFVKCHAGEENKMEALTRNLGKEWYTTRAALKTFSNCAGQWGAMDLFYALKKKHNLKPEEVEAVTCRVRPQSSWMVGTIKGEDVKDIFGAQFSARYGLGMALVLGDNRPKAYQQNVPPYGRYKEIVEVAKRVNIIGDPEVEAAGVKKGIFGYSLIEIKLKNGTVIKAESGWPKGFPQNPMTKEERLEKFYSQALMVVTRERADEIVRRVEKLEDQDDIRPLMNLLVR